MDYLTNYYRNRCEQLQEQINILKNMLQENSDRDEMVKTAQRLQWLDYAKNATETLLGAPVAGLAASTVASVGGGALALPVATTYVGYQGGKMMDALGAYDFLDKTKAGRVSLPATQNEYSKAASEAAARRKAMGIKTEDEEASEQGTDKTPQSAPVQSKMSETEVVSKPKSFDLNKAPTAKLAQKSPTSSPRPFA
jgi:hypothetical protein